MELLASYRPDRWRCLLAATLMLAATLSWPTTGQAEPRSYRIDPDHASIGFLVSHLGLADTLGMFRQVEGGFTFDDQAMTVSDVRVEVKTDSVYTAHEARDRHLRQKDFLWTDRYPTMTFVGREATRTGESTGTLTGDLTLRGVTRPVTLDLTYGGMRQYPFGDKHTAIGVSARGTIRRSDFGMDYALADMLVGDEVQLLISFEGIRQD